jgi:hypothetical protein
LEFYVTIIEDKSLCHELLEEVAVNRFKFGVLLQTVHECLDIALVAEPVLLVLLNLILSLT